MNYAADSEQCLSRILASVDLSMLSKRDSATFVSRLEAHFPTLFQRYTINYSIAQPNH